MGISIISLLILPVYLAILSGIFYLIYTWVRKFIIQNDLLREIIKKMDHKES